MTSLELYNLYISAYVRKSKADRSEFISALRTFDFSTFRLFSDQLVEAWQFAEPIQESKELLSGGSTSGESQRYNYGPFLGLMDIEILQKSAGGQFLWLSGTHRDRPHVTYQDKFTFQFRYDGSNLSELFYFIDSYFDRTKQKITLCSLPHNFLYLTAHPRFVDWLLHNHHKKITSLVTTDWEPIFKKSFLIQNGIHINDCMIDWQTGLNFHTCRFGKKHILPIFALHGSSIINWTNLANKKFYSTIDSYKIDNLKPVKCKCGGYLLGFEVIHRGLKCFPFRRGLGELVRSHYANLQFVRDRDRIAIFYKTVGPMLDCDRDLFDDVFKDYSIEYVPNKLGMTGTKWPSYWDVSAGPVRAVDFTY